MPVTPLEDARIADPIHEKVPSGEAVRLTLFDFGLYALVVFIWGTSWLALHMQLGVVAPEISLFWRFALAALVMMGFVVATGRRLRFPPADHFRFLAMGATLFSANFAFFYYGGLSTPSGLLAVVFSLTAVFNMLMAAAFFGQQSTGKAIAAALMGFAGVGLMFTPQLSGAQFSAGALIGLIDCVAGTLLFCVGNMVTLANKRRAIPLASATAWGMTYGAALLLAFSLVRGQSFTIEPNLRYAGALIWSALLSSVVAFGAYLTLLNRIGASRAGYSTVLFPVVALAVSTVFEGYVWTWPAIAGLAIVIAGNLLMLAPKR